MNFTVLKFDSLDSTNTEALKQARLGASEGLCIVARQQTAGRGRHGRVWESSEHTGLYFSIVLRPQIETRYLPLITLTTGVAVFETLKEFGLDPDIKWVNDVLVNEKKISGILAETTDSGGGLAVVVGVGINLRSSNFPPEIADIATSIEAETGNQISQDETITPLIRQFEFFYNILQSGNGPGQIISEWCSRSTFACGKQVKVILENEAFSGTTEGLEENGALRVRSGEGELKIIQAGDVEKLRSLPLRETSELPNKAY